MLESVISWLTPAALFILLNIVIGTIAFTSSRSSSSAAGGPHHTSSKLSRSPSFVLDRLKSFNLYSSHRHYDPSASETIPTVEIPKMEQCEPEAPQPQPQPEHHIGRSKSDTQPAAGEMPRKLAKKLKKSATLKSAFNRFDFHEVGAEQESSSPPKRPATMREREKEEEVEVDARADDFINRFKQQLKLQRLDSIIRYKEMLNRGN